MLLKPERSMYHSSSSQTPSAIARRRSQREAMVRAEYSSFTVDHMAELVRTGLATTSSERVMAGKTPMEVTRVRITNEGRRALAVVA